MALHTGTERSLKRRHQNGDERNHQGWDRVLMRELRGWCQFDAGLVCCDPVPTVWIWWCHNWVPIWCEIGSAEIWCRLGVDLAVPKFDTDLPKI